MILMHPREQSSSEEIANSISHGFALIGALVALPLLLIASCSLSLFGAIGVGVFAITLVFLFLTSTLYHALPAGRTKRLALRLDQGAIYVFIAGTYTPFALGAMGGPADWNMFGLVWALALCGATLKAFDLPRHPGLSTALYLLMGWMALIAAVPLLAHMPPQGTGLLVAGGAAYTVGVVFFVLDARMRYGHTVWHGFVTLGSGCHFFAVLGFAA